VFSERFEGSAVRVANRQRLSFEKRLAMVNPIKDEWASIWDDPLRYNVAYALQDVHRTRTAFHVTTGAPIWCDFSRTFQWRRFLGARTALTRRAGGEVVGGSPNQSGNREEVERWAGMSVTSSPIRMEVGT
jgi:hypothetical protein